MCILAALCIKCADSSRDCDKTRRKMASSDVSPSTGIDPKSASSLTLAFPRRNRQDHRCFQENPPSLHSNQRNCARSSTWTQSGSVKTDQPYVEDNGIRDPHAYRNKDHRKCVTDYRAAMARRLKLSADSGPWSILLTATCPQIAPPIGSNSTDTNTIPTVNSCRADVTKRTYVTGPSKHTESGRQTLAIASFLKA